MMGLIRRLLRWFASIVSLVVVDKSRLVVRRWGLQESLQAGGPLRAICPLEQLGLLNDWVP